MIRSFSRYISITANHIAITAHFIDNLYTLRQPLLAFELLEDRHTGVNLAAIIMKVFHEYDIAEKLYCITTDNASNNFTMVKTLSERLQEEDIEWDWKLSTSLVSPISST